MKSVFCAAALALQLSASSVWAQALAAAYPSRPITLIVPFAAGGGTDMSARKIGELLTKALGQPVVVDNKPGAGGMIGMQMLARAVPDGYTLGWAGNSPLTIGPYVTKRPLYDPQRAFTPVALACVSSFTYTARKGLGVRTLPELVALARKEPGRITYASSGQGTSTQMLSELLKVAANIDLLHIPYKGESEGIQAMLSGQVDTMALSSDGALQYRQGERLVSLATTGPSRLAGAPDVPTVAEAGYPGLQLELFYGLVAPAGTQPAIVERLNAEMRRAVADPDFVEVMRRTGYDTRSGPAKDFADLLSRHTQQWLEVIARNRISID